MTDCVTEVSTKRKHLDQVVLSELRGWKICSVDLRKCISGECCSTSSTTCAPKKVNLFFLFFFKTFRVRFFQLKQTHVFQRQFCSQSNSSFGALQEAKSSTWLSLVYASFGEKIYTGTPCGLVPAKSPRTVCELFGHCYPLLTWENEGSGFDSQLLCA